MKRDFQSISELEKKSDAAVGFLDKELKFPLLTSKSTLDIR
jgi:hypothetical protein